MPGNGANEQGGSNDLLITAVSLLLLILITALSRHRYRQDLHRRAQDRHWEAIWGRRENIPHSLRRGDFSRHTREQAQLGYCHAQLLGLGQQAPTAQELQDARAIFGGEILGQRGGGFHLRHIIADNFLRRAVQHVLNGRQPERLALVRALFLAMNAHNLVATWDDIAHRLQNGRRELNWYQILGANRVDDLRYGLNNTVEQLFYSESQGNLLTGTHVDVTGDTLGILGEDRIRLIMRRAVDLMESLNLMPRLVQVENEIFLGYEGSSGAYRQYGYNPLFSHDSPEDPLRFLEYRQSLLILSRSELAVSMRYLLRYRRTETLAALLLILSALWLRL